MREKWVDVFCQQLRASGLDCQTTNRIKGWPETVTINGRNCYAKSVSYNNTRAEYFQGVDPKKLAETGDLVLICGGRNDEVRDIFLIPWNEFFGTLRRGDAINTYQPPKEYLQYKFRLRDRNGKWTMFVQGKSQPRLDISERRFEVAEAVEEFK